MTQAHLFAIRRQEQAILKIELGTRDCNSLAFFLYTFYLLRNDNENKCLLDTFRLSPPTDGRSSGRVVYVIVYFVLYDFLTNLHIFLLLMVNKIHGYTHEYKLMHLSHIYFLKNISLLFLYKFRMVPTNTRYSDFLN